MEQAILTLPYDIDTICYFLRQALADHGFRADRSFQVEQACASFADPICPHSGSSQCGCRLVALAIQGPEGQALSLVLHQHDQTTELWADPVTLRWTSAFARQVQQILFTETGLVSHKDWPGFE